MSAPSRGCGGSQQAMRARQVAGSVDIRYHPPPRTVASTPPWLLSSPEQIMAKMKTKRSAAKRFSFTASGKVKHGGANHRHCLTAKAKSAKVRARGVHYLEPGDAHLVKLMMPYA
jgi:large subunit ribosomal protein L35